MAVSVEAEGSAAVALAVPDNVLIEGRRLSFLSLTDPDADGASTGGLDGLLPICGGVKNRKWRGGQYGREDQKTA